MKRHALALVALTCLVGCKKTPLILAACPRPSTGFEATASTEGPARCAPKLPGPRRP